MGALFREPFTLKPASQRPVTPRISLIIPSYNAVATMERTITSIAAQNYPSLEVILMDGGSRDGTMEIVQRYAGLFKVMVSEPDRGQAHAINKGFRLATGEIFGWLCADDELSPGALAQVAELFQKNPEASLLTGGCARVFADGTIIHTEPQPQLWSRLAYQDGIEQPSTFWKASLHRAAGELDESYNFTFDWDWWNRMKRSGAKLATTPQILSRYHFSDSNKTSTGARALVNELYRVIKKYGPLRGYLADIYMFLYKNFDLHGYYDRPPKHHPMRGWFFRRALRILTSIWGKEIIYGYNWNFASKQERNLCWYK